MQRARGDRSPGDRSLGGAARFRLLEALKAAESTGRRMGVSEVAEAIRVDQPRASRLVNDSAERGLVTRRADERDARRSVIELTDAGRTMLESTRAKRRSAVTDALEGFTAEETAALAALLTRFVGKLPR
jgi:DNA-binding MarR family transcriptional regulator